MTYYPPPPRPRIIIHRCVNGEYPTLAAQTPDPPPIAKDVDSEPDPPDPSTRSGGEGDHPRGGGGALPSEVERASADIPDAAYWPDPRRARAGDPRNGERTHPQGGRESRPSEVERAPSEHPEAEGPEPESPEAERIRLMRAWLDKHWDTVEAMARADEAPQRPAPPPPAPKPGDAAPRPPVHVRKGDRWNKPKMAEFLRQLAATHSVSAAARAVGMHRRSAYKLRARLKGQPFDIAWETAFRHGYDNLAHAALELALEGEKVPHYYQGELRGTHRKRNAPLIVQLLKMRNRAGAPMLGRYGAAAEWWGDRWDLLLERVETGSVDWSDEHGALGEQGLARLGLPDGAREADQLVERNAPDERHNGR